MCEPVDQNMTRGMRQRDFTYLEQGSKKSGTCLRNETKLGVGVSGISVGKEKLREFCKRSHGKQPQQFLNNFFIAQSRKRCTAASESRVLLFDKKNALVKSTPILLYESYIPCVRFTRASRQYCATKPTFDISKLRKFETHSHTLPLIFT